MPIAAEDLSDPLASSVLPAEICMQLTSSEWPQNAFTIPISGSQISADHQQ